MIVGIPHYNDFEGLKNCINSFLDSTLFRDFSLLIINSDDKEKQNIQEFLSSLPIGFRIKMIQTPKEGPLKAYNNLFDIARERKEDLFLTQTDVIFPKKRGLDWLQNMKIIAQENKNCGLITCYGGGGHSGPQFINGFQWVGAWCTYIPYRTLEKIGNYDNNFPLGWAVDIDYTYAVYKAGLKKYTINYWVDHYPNYIIGHKHEKVSNIEELKKEAYRYMREKWKVGEYATIEAQEKIK